MTEKEKMLAHQWYDANFDSELINDRKKAKDLCFDYNHTKPSHEDERNEILKSLFQSNPENIDIAIPFDTDYGWNVTFGDNVFVGPNCGFYTATHPLKYEDRNKGLELAEPISVGSNTWFGGNVVVLPGVTIGEGSVIGAGSVVTKDIPPNS